MRLRREGRRDGRVVSRDDLARSRLAPRDDNHSRFHAKIAHLSLSLSVRVHSTPRARFFVEALLGLAEQLGDVAPKKRAEKLQEGLERINEFFLSERAQGSDVIYVPFRGGFRQVIGFLLSIK